MIDQRTKSILLFYADNFIRLMFGAHEKRVYILKRYFLIEKIIVGKNTVKCYILVL